MKITSRSFEKNAKGWIKVRLAFGALAFGASASSSRVVVESFIHSFVSHLFLGTTMRALF